MLAIRQDAEFKKFFKDCDFKEAGRVPVGVPCQKQNKKKKGSDQQDDDSSDDEMADAGVEEDE